MIALTLLRELDLAFPTEAGRPLHLSAASGLICIQSRAYAIADDELHLGVFRLDRNEPGQLIRLFDGTLPAKAGPRKKEKPDIEAIVKLPASSKQPHGALLVLGSGSRANRQRGAILTLDASGGIAGSPRVVDISSLYAALHSEFDELNIEGAAVIGNEMLLLQRGNKGDNRNALVRFALDPYIDAISAAGRADIVCIDQFDLGEIAGIPLSFTDAAALPDGRLLFVAAAEDTGNAYDDGRCAGAAAGIIKGSTLQRLEPFERPCKIEGVHAHVDGGIIRLLLVTDADDAATPAQLLAATLNYRSEVETGFPDQA
jgi:hypothetical protein